MTYTTKPARLATVLAAALAFTLSFCATALAGPAWRVSTLSNTTVAPGTNAELVAQLSNVGNEPMNGEQIAIVATLPASITPVDATMVFEPLENLSEPCKIESASVVRCTNTRPLEQFFGGGGKHYELVRLTVKVSPGATGDLKMAFAVSGGGAAPAQTVDPTSVTSATPAFGVSVFDGQALDAVGEPSTQAGAHPADASVSIGYNTFTNPAPLAGLGWPVEPLRDVTVALPPGLVGDPTAVDQCTAIQLANTVGPEARALCASTTQVGTIALRANDEPFFMPEIVLPLFNMVPPPGVPARFGFNFAGTVVTLDATVRNGGDYGISVSSKNISEALSLAGTTVDLWGIPSDPSHDLERACPGQARRRWLARPVKAVRPQPPSCAIPPPAPLPAWDSPRR